MPFQQTRFIMYKLILPFLSLCFFLSAQEEILPEEIVFSDSIIAPSLQMISSDELLPDPPELIKKTKSPTLAVGLSMLLPGLGHYYLGENQKANELLSSAILTGAGMYASRNDPNFSQLTGSSLGAIGAYSIFSAYRDTFAFNGQVLQHMPRDTFADLAKAPFQWSVIKKPEVWGGVLGSLTIASTLSYFVFVKNMGASAHENTRIVMPFSAMPIAISEEAIFRGLLQTSFLQKMPAWSAITLSSLVFGAAHIPNAKQLDENMQNRYYTFSLPLITSLGAYMGWLTYKNNSLKESVAVHAWYDFALFLTKAFAQASIGEPTHFCYGFTF